MIFLVDLSVDKNHKAKTDFKTFDLCFGQNLGWTLKKNNRKVCDWNHDQVKLNFW